MPQNGMPYRWNLPCASAHLQEQPEPLEQDARSKGPCPLPLSHLSFQTKDARHGGLLNYLARVQRPLHKAHWAITGESGVNPHCEVLGACEPKLRPKHMKCFVDVLFFACQLRTVLCQTGLKKSCPNRIPQPATIGRLEDERLLVIPSRHHAFET